MLLAFMVHHGHVAFHGPSVMAGWAQAASFPASFLARYEYPTFGAACDG